ncbi:hypothetical protein Tco_0704233 [Tanacetum coccineum]|uniref:Retrovirus-related Pol polyprotein from transposon TNT 1-94 n=1 Tax=Tanacetum coccineum TaxID=301880 RepID=A0ABQ4Y2I9_9ASTR
MCHIVGIEPQFENIISNGPYIPMAASQRKPEIQWTPKERKAANLDQRLKSLILYVLLDDQMNSVINCLTEKSTWDDLILYHEGPSDVKESRVMDLKLCYNTFKFKEVSETETKLASLFGKLKYKENLINNIYDTNKEKTLVPATPLSTTFFSTFIIQDSQDSPDDEEDTRSSQEVLKGLAVQKQLTKLNATNVARRVILQETAGQKHQFLHISHLFNQNFSIHLNTNLNQGIPKTLKPSLIAESYDWDEEEASSDDNEVPEVKALMALADKERVPVSKESARNGEWIKISMKKIHALLEMEDNDDRESFLDYLCIDLNYHVNIEILKENQNLRNKLKELTSIIEAWLNSYNEVNQCISKQIPTQKKKILGIDQLTEDTSSSKPKDLVFVKSLADNSEVSITGSNKPKLSEAKDSTLSNPDTGKVPLNELQRNTTDHSVVVSDSSATDYDSADESLVCITINEPSSAPARGNKSSLVSKTNSAPAGTDISKITRKQSKTGKHGHGKRKSTKEAKDSKPQSKKVNLQSNWSNPGQQKVKNVISRALIGSLKLEGHVAIKKAQGDVGFTLISLTQLAQGVTSKE